MRTLLVTETDDFTAEESLGAAHYLMEAVDRGRTQANPWLLISRPISKACLSLGRFQREGSATDFQEAEKLNIPILRRISGGTSSLLGEGFIHLAFAVALKDSPIHSDPRQFLQKHSSLVVKSLSVLGLKARYSGRDLITIDDSPVAVVSFDIDENRIALLECIIALEKPIVPDEKLYGYPSQVRESPKRDNYTCLNEIDPDITYEKLISAVKASVQESMKVNLEFRRFNPLEKERIRSLLRKVNVKPPSTGSMPAYLKRWVSRPIEESIGFVESSVGVTQGRFLKEVSIQGDFMADSAGIKILEEKLKMCPIKRRQIALTIDDVLGSPEHVILGVRRLGSILEAIMDAAQKGVQEAEGT